MNDSDRLPLTSSTGCEYNPLEKRAAYESELHAAASVLVGANGQWRLCESCAALPEFNKFRKRRKIGWRKETEKAKTD